MMEEVDSIVLRQLKEIGCDLDVNEDDDEHISSLKQLEAHTVMNCIVKCVRLISNDDSFMNGVQMSSNMNMSNKYKVATQLAHVCQDLGFKGDLGYQTFLYGNETDLRKLFLFLVEKFPKDELPVHATIGTTSDNIAHQISRLGVNLTWLPPMYDEQVSGSNIWKSSPVTSGMARSLLINKVAPNRRKYYDTALRLPSNAASLMEWNSLQLNKDEGTHWMSKSKNVIIERVKSLLNESQKDAIDGIIVSKLKETRSVGEEKEMTGLVDEKSDEGVTLTKEQQQAAVIEQLEEELQEYQQQISSYQASKLEVDKLELQFKLEKEKLIQLESSHKSQAELRSEVKQLKNEIERMCQQWQEVEGQLTSEWKQLQMQHQAKTNRSAQQRRELNDLKKSISAKIKEIKSKETMINELNCKMPSEWPPGRSSYTKRILEIVNNVKKQNEETRKVLLETRSLQKEINTLSGKLSRTFTVADEVIFKEARSNDWNRKCYKLLASMHDHCDQLLSSVGSIGTILREIRQLEELVETEKSRKTTSNLQRILADLNQIKLENQQLSKKLKPEEEH